MYHICIVKIKTRPFFFNASKNLFFLVGFLAFACNDNPSDTAQGSWIKGSEGEKINKIEKQFRGFDQAMVETGYRYQELYWAGQDENWEYAEYQVKKIRIAIENGLERRPKRAKSAEHFLENVLPEMEQSIESRDKIIFKKGFETFTNSCNSCHAMEDVVFFNVKIPSNRLSPIKK